MATAARTAQVEVIVGEPLSTPIESAFGHAAIRIDESVYSRWHYAYVKTFLPAYLDMQSPYRSSTGYILAVTPAEKRKILAFIENRRNKVNATNASKENYNIITDIEAVIDKPTSIHGCHSTGRAECEARTLLVRRLGNSSHVVISIRTSIAAPRTSLKHYKMLESIRLVSGGSKMPWNRRFESAMAFLAPSRTRYVKQQKKKKQKGKGKKIQVGNKEIRRKMQERQRDIRHFHIGDFKALSGRR